MLSGSRLRSAAVVSGVALMLLYSLATDTAGAPRKGQEKSIGRDTPAALRRGLGRSKNSVRSVYTSFPGRPSDQPQPPTLVDRIVSALGPQASVPLALATSTRANLKARLPELLASTIEASNMQQHPERLSPLSWL